MTNRSHKPGQQLRFVISHWSFLIISHLSFATSLSAFSADLRKHRSTGVSPAPERRLLGSIVSLPAGSRRYISPDRFVAPGVLGIPWCVGIRLFRLSFRNLRGSLERDLR